jgi:hypothetical protein
VVAFRGHLVKQLEQIGWKTGEEGKLR